MLGSLLHTMASLPMKTYEIRVFNMEHNLDAVELVHNIEIET